MEAIRNYLLENSNPASNRLIVNRNKYDLYNYKKEISARYLEKNSTELYRNFPFRNQLSKTTFFKYISISGEYKRPIRMTDLCDYCETGKRLKRSIIERFFKFLIFNLRNRKI